MKLGYMPSFFYPENKWYAAIRGETHKWLKGNGFMITGYRLIIWCVDCGKDDVSCETLRVPVDESGISLFKCNCQEKPQYVVRYDVEEINDDELELNEFRNSYAVEKSFLPEDIANVGKIEYGVLYICSKKISEQEAEIRMLSYEHKTFFKVPSRFLNAPESVTVRIEDILEKGWQDPGIKKSNIKFETIDDVIEEISTMNELFILRYREKGVEGNQYRLLIQLSKYESRFPRFAIAYIGREVKVEVVTARHQIEGYLFIGKFEYLFPDEEAKQEVREALEHWLSRA